MKYITLLLLTMCLLSCGQEARILDAVDTRTPTATETRDNGVPLTLEGNTIGYGIGHTQNAVFTLGEGWQHLVTLPRQNLSPHRFRMTDAWIDPITQAYIEGRDFLFVIYSEGYIKTQRYLLEQIEPPPATPKAQVFHFPDPDAFWFQYYGRAEFQDRTNAGLTVAFHLNLMFEPSNPALEKKREYLYAPELGTSLKGFGVGFAGAPEIREGFELKIYVR